MAGTYNDNTAAESCLFCPEDSTSADGSTNITDCKCVQGTYFLENQCATCPAGTSSAQASIRIMDCKCKAGYSASSEGVECVACRSGTYKERSGSVQCSSCPPNTMTEQLGSVAIIDCVCKAGYTTVASNSECVLCPAGSIKLQTGLQECTLCPIGSFKEYGVTGSCDPCPRGMSSQKGTGSIDKCSACLANTYNSGGGCNRCPQGTFSPALSSSVSDCTCRVQHESSEDGSECSACIPGTFKAFTGKGLCASCPFGSSGPQGILTLEQCKCNRGYTKILDRPECEKCDNCLSTLDFVVQLDTTVSQFSNQKQFAFIASVANALQVTDADVKINKYSDTLRRRLLARVLYVETSVLIDTKIAELKADRMQEGIIQIDIPGAVLIPDVTVTLGFEGFEDETTFNATIPSGSPTSTQKIPVPYTYIAIGGGAFIILLMSSIFLCKRPKSSHRHHKHHTNATFHILFQDVKMQTRQQDDYMPLGL